MCMMDEGDGGVLTRSGIVSDMTTLELLFWFL